MGSQNEFADDGSSPNGVTLDHVKPAQIGARRGKRSSVPPPMVPDISIITHYHNHPQKVLEQIAYWESLPPSFLSRVEFILVDDCSEKSPAIPSTILDLRVFRIATRIAWNQTGARNLGAFTSRGKWGLFFDLDQRFCPKPIENTLNHLEHLDNMTMYHFRAESYAYRPHESGPIIPRHPNTFIVNMEQFKLHGMYDEDFAGHPGYGDIYMTTHWEHEGGKSLLLSDFTSSSALRDYRVT